VEEVVQVMYTNPARVGEANAWLMDFTSSPAAWEISVALLRSAEANVRFFAANAVHIKVKAEGDELPPDTLPWLLNTLLAAMQTPECAQPNILTKLCLAVVALGLHLAQEPGKIQSTLLDSPSFLSLSPAPALEFFLLLPQEWDRISLTKRRQDKALSELALQLPRVVSLIQAPPRHPLRSRTNRARTASPQTVFGELLRLHCHGSHFRDSSTILHHRAVRADLLARSAPTSRTNAARVKKYLIGVFCKGWCEVYF